MRTRIATILQAAGLAVAALSTGAIYAPAGGLVAAIGLVLFGLAAEKE